VVILLWQMQEITLETVLETMQETVQEILTVHLQEIALKIVLEVKQKRILKQVLETNNNSTQKETVDCLFFTLINLNNLYQSQAYC